MIETLDTTEFFSDKKTMFWNNDFELYKRWAQIYRAAFDGGRNRIWKSDSEYLEKRKKKERIYISQKYCCDKEEDEVWK